jgi:hypothetical protein
MFSPHERFMAGLQARAPGPSFTYDFSAAPPATPSSALGAAAPATPATSPFGPTPPALAAPATPATPAIPPAAPPPPVSGGTSGAGGLSDFERRWLRIMDRTYGDNAAYNPNYLPLKSQLTGDWQFR